MNSASSKRLSKPSSVLSACLLVSSAHICTFLHNGIKVFLILVVDTLDLICKVGDDGEGYFKFQLVVGRDAVLYVYAHQKHLYRVNASQKASCVKSIRGSVTRAHRHTFEFEWVENVDAHGKYAQQCIFGDCVLVEVK